MQQFLAYVKANKLFLLFVAVVTSIFVILIIGIVFISQKPSPSNQQRQQTQPNNTITNIPVPTQQQVQQPFHVIKTAPTNNETDVYPGEINISFTSDVDILSKNAFSLIITPNLPYPLTDESTYPTKTVQEKVIGGLKQGTTYTITIKNSKGASVNNWSFTTSQKSAESSSALTATKQQEEIERYYPLFTYLPYSTADFSIDYYDRLILVVHIKNANTAAVKNEVITWIRSHGVNPSTHTINYVNDF